MIETKSYGKHIYNAVSLVHSNSHPHARQISHQDLITQYEGSKDRRHIALWPISLQPLCRED